MRVWMRKSQSRYYYVAIILNQKIIPRLRVPIQVIMLHALSIYLADCLALGPKYPFHL
jgi:hypothetical protein